MMEAHYEEVNILWTRQQSNVRETLMKLK